MYVNTCHGLQKYGNVQWGQGNIKIALSALAGYQNFNTLHIPNLCMSLDDHKKLLNRELEQFNSILGEILPRYLDLMKKKGASDEEEKELGDIEHFLIEINAKIAEIKNKLDQDLFGETMNHYYAAKEAAMKGDSASQKRLDNLRRIFLESVQGNDFFNWN
jgi:hypothetical protein